jgi:SOS-response transcriptional repressor LexA
MRRMSAANDIRKREAARRRARLAEFILIHLEDKQKAFIDLTRINQGELSALLKDKSFGSVKARGLERAAHIIEGSLDMPEGSPFYETNGNHMTPDSDAPVSGQNAPDIVKLSASRRDILNTNGPKDFDQNVAQAPEEARRIPILSYVQAGTMTEAIDPYTMGDEFEEISTDLELSSSAFGVIIEGPSMQSMFNEGDKVVIDPAVTPQPGDFVLARNGGEKAIFRKYRPRGTSESGEMVFELVPLNDDFPTLHSERDHLRIIGVMMEHRTYRRR